jgi:hypothetical protein
LTRESQRNNKRPRKNVGEENRGGQTRTKTERLTVAKRLSREKDSDKIHTRSRTRQPKQSPKSIIRARNNESKDEWPGEVRNKTLAVKRPEETSSEEDQVIGSRQGSLKKNPDTIQHRAKWGDRN